MSFISSLPIDPLRIPSGFPIDSSRLFNLGHLFEGNNCHNCRQNKHQCCHKRKHNKNYCCHLHKHDNCHEHKHEKKSNLKRCYQDDEVYDYGYKHHNKQDHKHNHDSERKVIIAGNNSNIVSTGKNSNVLLIKNTQSITPVTTVV